MFVVFELNRTKSAIYENAKESGAKSVLLVTSHLESLVSQMNVIILDVINSIDAHNTQKWTTQDWDGLCADRIRYNPHLEGLKIVDENGAYLGTENKVHAKATLADREYFKTHKSNPDAGVILAPPVVSKTSGNWVLVVSRRWNKKNGDFGGVVIATIPLKFISDFYSNLGVGKDGNASVFRESDYTLYARYPELPAATGKPVLNSMLRKRILETGAEEGNALVESSLGAEAGKVKQYVFKKIPALGLIAVIGFSQAELLQDWKFNAALTTLGVLLGVPLFWIILLRFLKLSTLEEIRAREILEKDLENQKAIKVILDSLDQGFMAFDPKGQVLPGVSQSTQSLFKTDPVGKNFFEVLGLTVTESLEFWLSLMFKSTLEFQDVKALGPQAVSADAGQFIALDYKRVYDANQDVQQIVVVATDKTEERNLRIQARQEMEFGKQIANILKYKLEFADLISSLNSMIERIQNLSKNHFDKESGQSLMSELHTLKGGVGFFYLRDWVDLLHETESLLSGLLKDHNSAGLQAIAQKVTELQTKIQEFILKNRSVLGKVLAHSEPVKDIPTSQLNSFFKNLKAQFTETSPLVRDFSENFLKESLSNCFGKYEDLVSQWAENQGKKIQFNLRSTDIRVDPAYFQELSETMIHAVLNAVDHGIESPEERQLQNKAEIANIDISFQKFSKNQTSWVRLIVADDGRGIDPEAIAKSILNKKLMSEADLRKMEPLQILQLIFMPGFSTRTAVTTLSGRGVGLDAIKSAAVSLHGDARVESQLNKGSKLIVEVPLPDSDKSLESRI